MKRLTLNKYWLLEFKNSPDESELDKVVKENAEANEKVKSLYIGSPEELNEVLQKFVLLWGDRGYFGHVNIGDHSGIRICFVALLNF